MIELVIEMFREFLFSFVSFEVVDGELGILVGL
jgi:hypothetical protein